jgi:hypothetical protein
MRRLWLALLLAGCAISGPSGPPPKVPAPRAVTLQLDVTGTGTVELNKYLDWALSGSGLLKRSTSGADARLAIEASYTRKVAILAGTDLLLIVRVHGDNLDETRRWSRTGLTSGVPVAEDQILSDAAMWTLGRAVNVAASASLAPPPPPEPPPTQLSAAPDEPPPAAEPPRKKKRKR